MLCCALLCVHSSFAIISMGKRFVCLPGVSWLLCGSSSQCHRVVCSLSLWYFLIILTIFYTCGCPQNFSEWVQLCLRYFFLSWWGEGGSKYHYEQAIMGPLAKRLLNGVSLACRWWPNVECWLGSFMIFQGIQTSIAKKPYIFVIFQGVGGTDPLSPLLWICACIQPYKHTFSYLSNLWVVYSCGSI